VHVVEPFVDLLEITVVSDKLVDPELSVHVVCRVATGFIQLEVGMRWQVSLHLPPTIPGNSVRPLTPPNADPRQTRPVTCVHTTRWWLAGEQGSTDTGDDVRAGT